MAENTLSSIYEKNKGYTQSSVLDLQDTLYQSATIAAKSEIQKTAIDITKECVITDDSNWKAGEYEVRFETVYFKAYYNGDNHYKVNETVYVLIPRGDQSLQKFIIGRKTDKEDESILYNYKFPFDDFVQLKRLIRPTEQQHGFLANCNILMNNTSGTSDYDLIQNKFLSLASGNAEVDLSTMTTDTNFQADNEILIAEWHNSADTPGPTVGDRLGITMNVQTFLVEQAPVRGMFGVRIHIKGLLKKGSTTDERDCYFKSTDMYGNPYAYTAAKEQQMIFDISDYLRLDSIEVYFIQDFLFFNERNEYIQWKRGETKLPPNILINKIGVYLGFQASTLGANELFIYTYDGLTYGENPDSPLERVNMDMKSVYLAYIYYNSETKTYELFDSEEEFQNAGIEIFWYVRDPNWTLDASNPAFDESKSEHKYSGLFWAPMSLENSELPTPVEGQNEAIYNKSSYTFLPDINKSMYKLRAAVRYKTAHTLSDIIEFTNYKDVEGDAQDLTRNNKIIVRVSTILYDNIDPARANHSIIYSSDDFSNFFVYDENNRVLMSDDKRTYEKDGITYIFPDNKLYSDMQWFADIWIREDIFKDIPEEARPSTVDGYVRLADFCYNIDYTANGLPIAQYVPFSVEWNIIPTPTMIKNFEPVPQATFNSVPYWNARSGEPVQFDGLSFSGEYPTKQDVDKLTTRQFHIAQSYDINANHNTLAVTIRRNGQEYTAKKELLFGRAMAQGCDYTPIIDIVQPVGQNFITEGQEFLLQCKVIDRFGKVYTNGYTCTWEFYGNHPSGQPGIPSGSSYYSIYPNQTENQTYYTGRLTAADDHMPFSVKCTVRGIGESNGGLPIDYKIYAIRGMLVTNNANWLSKYSVDSISRIEFNSDGQMPHYASGVFRVQKNASPMTESQKTALTELAKCYKNYYDKGISNINVPDDLKKFVSQSCIDIVVDYLGHNLYSVVSTELNELREYIGQDLLYPNWHLHVPHSLEQMVRLKSQPKYESVRYLVHSTDTQDNTLNYQYYDAENDLWVAVNYTDPENTRNYIADKNSGVLFYYKSIVRATYSDGTSENAPNANEYYLSYGKQQREDYDTYWQWKDELDSDNYFSWLSFSIDQNTTITQGIAFQRYVYASSLVNEWDGVSLTLDEENGAILSTMIAAGTKNANNQFTGIMLGNWSAKADSSMDKAGLYGFQNGSMSFGFTEDGTGFIGPSGAGRIQFDGRNAMISNSTKTCYLNLNPATVSYYDTARNWYDNSDVGASQYFLYCKVPVNVNDTITSYAEKVKMRWVDEFLKDESNNYFIIDPNHGALITGGIATKYGRIGNWYINNDGLYQSYEDINDAKNSRYMYLGMPSFNTINKNTLDTKLNAVVTRYGQSGYITFATEQRRKALYQLLLGYLNSANLTSQQKEQKLQLIYESYSSYYDNYNANLTATANAQTYINTHSNPGVPEGTVYNNNAIDLGYLETYLDAANINLFVDKINEGEIQLDNWAGLDVESVFRNLSKYFDQGLFELDVYHFYTFGTSAHNVAAFLQRCLDEFHSYPLDFQTPEFLWQIIYGDSYKLTQVNYNSENPNDWSVDGPYSLRNLETHLHNHYGTNGSNATTRNYRNKNYSNVSVSIPANKRYRYTANYGYQTNITSLLNGWGFSISPSGWWDPEIDPEGNGSVIYKTATDYVPDTADMYENNPWERYYDDMSGSYAWRSTYEYSAYIRVTPIGEVAPRYRPGATVSITTPSGSSSVRTTWYKNDNVALNAVPLKTLDGYLSVSGTNMILTNTGMSRSNQSVNPDWLVGYIQALELIYSYYRECFCYQLADMLQSGLNRLQTSDPEEYEVVTTLLESAGGLDAIRSGALDVTNTSISSQDNEPSYNDEEVQRMVQLYRQEGERANQQITKDKLEEMRQAMQKILFEESDSNKFAIYTGYQSPFYGGQYATDPFFSVRWNGYMTARHGKIGKDSPWYISDAGLTQTNNFGTIFLGSPDQDGSSSTVQNLINPNKASFMDEYGRPINIRGDDGSYQAVLLKNGGYIQINGETKFVQYYSIIDSDGRDEYHRSVVPYSNGSNVWVRYDSTAGKYKAYAGPSNEVILSDTDTRYLGPNAFGELGRFAIYAGSSGTIHFGIRLDGTIYADRGNLGAWLLDNQRIGTYKTYEVTNNSGTTQVMGPIIELNSQGFISIANGNILLDGRSSTKAIATFGSLSKNAEVSIAGFYFSSDPNVDTFSAQVRVNQGSGQSQGQSQTYKWYDYYRTKSLTVYTGFAGSGGGYSYATQIAILQQQKVDKESELALLQAQGNSNSAEVITLQNQINDLNNQIASLQAQASQGGSGSDTGLYPTDVNTWNFNTSISDNVSNQQVYYSGNKLNIFYDESNLYNGISLYIGNPYNPDTSVTDTTSSVVALQPIIGTGHLINWNLKGDSVIANYINGNSISVGGEAVATQQWVNTIKTMLLERINTANNTANSAASDAASGISGANQAAALAQDAANKAIQSLAFEVSDVGSGFVSLTVNATTVGGGTINCVNSSGVIASIHRHEMNVNISNGEISVTSGGMTGSGGGGGENSSDMIFGSQGIRIEHNNGEITVTATVAYQQSTSTCDISSYVNSAFEDGWDAACGSAAMAGDKQSLTVTSPAGRSHTFDISSSYDAGEAAGYAQGWADAIAHARLRATINQATYSLGGSVTGVNGANRSFKRGDGTYADPVYCYTGWNDTHYVSVDSSASINWSNVSFTPI